MLVPWTSEPYVSNTAPGAGRGRRGGGEDARALAERLTAPLESALRLALLDALSAAADEITRDLAPGSVHLRLRGREPSFVVTPPPAEPVDQADAPGRRAPAGRARRATTAPWRGSTSASAENLKARIEEAAEQAGLSVNSWLVRAAAAALDRTTAGRRADRAAPRRPALHRLGPLADPPTPAARAAPSDRPAEQTTGHRRPESGTDSISHPSGDSAMPTFDTPEPITVALELAVGDVRITAADRADTVVRSGRATNPASRMCAPPSRPGSSRPPVGCWSRRRSQRGLGLLGKPGSIDVTIELPAGSSVHGDAAVAAFRSRPPRRVPGQDRGWQHRARPDRAARPDHRGRRGHRGAGGRRRRGHYRIRPRPAGRDRRHGRDQELQRRHLGRRGRW